MAFRPAGGMLMEKQLAHGTEALPDTVASSAPLWRPASHGSFF